MNRVDWSFIYKEEGSRLRGYVPKNKEGKIIGKSGVTVGTGVDLGQRSDIQIRRLPISEDLKEKLIPYAGKRLEEAAKYLAAHPLILTKEEANMLDFAVLSEDVRIFIGWFERETKSKFSDQPWQAQTVMASLAINFGPNLAVKYPNTWAIIKSQNWAHLSEFLKNYPSKNPELQERRKREALLLKTI